MADPSRPTRPSPPSADPRVERAWREDRAYLLARATRMLGDRAAAEDVVQEAFGRLVRLAPADAATIEEVRCWLTVAVRRLGLNRLRAAYTRREAVAGATPPETGPADPVADPVDPADRVTLDDQVRRALDLVLDRLSPAERTSFVLHDVFGFPFTAVAEIVGRTPAACRQLASRARRTVRPAGTGSSDNSDNSDTPSRRDRPDQGVRAAQRQGVAERFAAACAGGDLQELMRLLDPEVVGHATLVGHGPFVHVEGRDQVMARVSGLFGPASGAVLVPLPVEAAAGVLATAQGQIYAVIVLRTALGDDAEHLVRVIEAFVLPAAVRSGGGS